MFRYFFQYFKLTSWIIYMLMYVGSEKPWLGDSIKFYFTLLYFLFPNIMAVGCGTVVSNAHSQEQEPANKFKATDRILRQTT